MGLPQPDDHPSTLQDVQTRLAMMGVAVTPSTARPGTPIREPLQLLGISLSETVIQLRDGVEDRG